MPAHSRDSSRQTSKLWGRPPTPPLKDDHSDTASTHTKRESSAGTDPDELYGPIRSRNLSRANSVYSISRVSFTNQITQLTSIQLPDAKSLSGSISAIPTAPKAARALSEAAGQIQAWVHKASEVLDGLDARDDVDWAAQAGRDGLGEVDGAIARFDSLVNVYVTAVEQLEMREDAGDVPGDDLQQAVRELEKIISEWQKIKNSLNRVRWQVELSLEWEELRNTIFEEIAQECDKLSSQVFEMEEQRHMVDPEIPTEPAIGLDLTELESMLEGKIGSPTTQKSNSHRDSFPQQGYQFPPPSPLQSPYQLRDSADTNLLGLFARMQPLRATLDFLPMRIQTFQNKASREFPTACGELEDRRSQLEEQWRKLEADAESLRKELGEDQWLLVFRNAGKQALRMIDSVERSITKLDEALDSNTQLRHAPATMKKVENYEAKKLHYCPAIERVIAIVDRGVKDRLTVNGEILRLQNDVQNKWQATLADVKNMDSTLEFYDAAKTQELRDSVSSVMSTDRSFLSSHVGSAGSSPASSIGPSSRALSRTRPPEVASHTQAPIVMRPRKLSTSNTTEAAKPATPASKRISSLPVPVTPASNRSGQQQKTPLTRSSVSTPNGLSPSSAQSSPYTPSYARPTSRISQNLSSPAIQARPATRLSSAPTTSAAASANKPRWNVSTNMNKTSIGHNFRPMAVTEPSPYRKTVTRVKYTPPGASRQQSSLSPMTPTSMHSRRTSANYSAASSVIGSPSPSLHPASISKSRRPSSLVLGQSVLSEAPSAPGSAVVDIAVESPTSTTTQPGTRPASSLATKNAKRSNALSPPSSQPRAQRTSAGTAAPASRGKALSTPSRAGLNRKKSDISNGGKL